MRQAEFRHLQKLTLWGTEGKILLVLAGKQVGIWEMKKKEISQKTNVAVTSTELRRTLQITVQAPSIGE